MQSTHNCSGTTKRKQLYIKLCACNSVLNAVYACVRSNTPNLLDIDYLLCSYYFSLSLYLFVRRWLLGSVCLPSSIACMRSFNTQPLWSRWLEHSCELDQKSSHTIQCDAVRTRRATFCVFERRRRRRKNIKIKSVCVPRVMKMFYISNILLSPVILCPINAYLTPFAYKNARDVDWSNVGFFFLLLFRPLA